MDNKLYIDIETYCELELGEVGVHRYSSHPSFKILLVGYGWNNELVESQTFEEFMDNEVILGLYKRPDVTKIAHNVMFEHTCLARWIDTPIEQWEDTMVMAAQAGFPMKLELAGKAMKLSEQKADGAALIRLFCTPNRRGFRTLPHEIPNRWAEFVHYNKQDVETERCMYKELSKFGMQEKSLFVIDWKINHRGVMVDEKLARNATNFANSAMGPTYEALMAETGLSRPTDSAIKKKYRLTSLDKTTVSELYSSRPDLRKMLDLRAQLNKTSLKKFEKMVGCSCDDKRAKGVTQFYGAGRTGRWSGRLIQLQNIPQIHLSDRALDLARQVVLDGQYSTFDLLYGDDKLGVLSQLIRTALVPKPGHKFVVADFSAIEARVLAWLADEEWRLDVFRGSGRIYEASAERMFNLPTGSVSKDNPVRQRGKVAELALGYGGGTGALTRMGALTMGIPEGDLPGLVSSWRGANPSITRFWRMMDQALHQTVETRKTFHVKHGVHTTAELGVLQIILPSKRRLTYQNARWDGHEVQYMGVNQVTNQWEEQGLYGAKATENVVQAIARDCLAEIIVFAEEHNFNPVFHVHDEIICEVPEGYAEPVYTDLLNRMAEPPDWAEGLPIKGDGFICDYYRK